MTRASRVLVVCAFALCLSQCAAAQVITTAAGSTWVFRGDGGQAINAPLGILEAVTVDPAGNIFFADRDNRLVMKVSPAGILTVVAGNGTIGFSGDGGPATSAALAFPTGVSVDASGNLYITDGHRIRKVTPSGTISTVAGNGTAGFSGDGGPATSTGLWSPRGVAVDASGNLYIADTVNNRIRRVSPSGTISTVAGNGISGFSGDGGSATSARLWSPSSVAVDASGNLYIADRNNNRIRKVTSSGTISTVAGDGTFAFSGDGGPATSATVASPYSVWLDISGNLYIADWGHHRIRKVTPSGTISTVAGNGTAGFSGDGGPATDATLDRPVGAAVDTTGNLYIADYNSRIRKVNPSGTISTVAGGGPYKFSGDGGPATSASLRGSGSTAVDASGSLYIADSGNHRIRKVTPAGTISTVAGNGESAFSGDGGPAASAALASPSSVAVDASGNLYIADSGNFRIRKVTPSGTISTVAGGERSGFSGDGGPATGALLTTPSGVAVDASGNLYIADALTHRIRRVTAAGTISTVAGNGTEGFSGDGGPATSAALNSPRGVSVDVSGNLYIADFLNYRVRKVTPSGTISTVAGNGTYGFSGDSGPATSAALSWPTAVAVDAAGNLYIADTPNNRLRKVTPAGTITTVAGRGTQAFSGDGGLASSAALFNPAGVALDAAGNVYIADSSNDRIRKVLATPPSFAVAPTSLTVTSSSGSESPVTRQIAVTSSVLGLAWTARSSDPWMTLSATSGAVPGTISVSLDASNLAQGTYRGAITVTAPLALPATQVVNVELAVGAALSPQLTVNPGALVVEVPLNTGNPPQQMLRITNAGGGGALNWTAQSEVLGAGNWLAVLSTSGTASDRAASSVPVRLGVAGLQPGMYSGLVHVASQAAGQRVDVPVTLLLSQQTKTILTSQRGLRYTAVEGSRTTVSQSLGIINAGQGTLAWTVEPSTLSGGGWLSASPASGQSEAGSLNIATTSVRVNPSGLAPGFYQGIVRVNGVGANNGPYPVTVDLEVLPAGAAAGVQVRPPQLIFTAQAGTSSPSSQTIGLSTPRNGSVEARGGSVTLEGGEWLEVLPSNLVLSANDPRTVVIQPRLGNLAPRLYRGALTFQFSDGSDPQTVDIFFLVVGSSLGPAGNGGVAACAAQTLIVANRSLGNSFTATVGSGAELEALVVDDCGNAVAGATVVASFSNSDPPLTLTDLGNGTYAGTWRPVTAASPVTVTIRASAASLSLSEVLIQGRIQSNDKAPVLFPGGLVNAASFSQGVPLAPGGIVSVFGRNLSTTASAASLPLPRTLGGATLTIGGIDAPLFYASDGQINAQLPFELQGNTRQQAVVRGTGTITLPETITIAPARPGIFTIAQDGKGQGAILSAQGRLVDVTAPAAPGETVQVFCTGLGATKPAVRSGDPAPNAEPLARVIPPPSATIGGQAARVSFAGLAPGFVGLYQVNVEIPAGLIAGSAVPLVLSQGGVPSNTVTLAVR